MPRSVVGTERPRGGPGPHLPFPRAEAGCTAAAAEDAQSLHPAPVRSARRWPRGEGSQTRARPSPGPGAGPRALGPAHKPRSGSRAMPAKALRRALERAPAGWPWLTSEAPPRQHSRQSPEQMKSQGCVLPRAASLGPPDRAASQALPLPTRRCDLAPALPQAAAARQLGAPVARHLGVAVSLVLHLGVVPVTTWPRGWLWRFRLRARGQGTCSLVYPALGTPGAALLALVLGAGTSVLGQSFKAGVGSCPWSAEHQVNGGLFTCGPSPVEISFCSRLTEVYRGRRLDPLQCLSASAGALLWFGPPFCPACRASLHSWDEPTWS